MPPRKKETVEEKPILGRFKSNLKIGIVGLPNVGKSSLFNTICKVSIPAENFPFCTIEPNNARVNVPDERFDWLVGLYAPKSQVPAFLEVVDIAGLVKGAAEGEGLGNAFLSNIQSVDGIMHVCRAFEDPDVTHVEDRVNPVEDLEIIHSELRAKDIERVTNHLGEIEKMRNVGKEKKEELEHCQKILAHLEEEKDIRFGDWSVKEIEFLNTMQLLTAKPVIYLINLSEKDYTRKKNKWLAKTLQWINDHGGEPLIPFSAALETKLVQMSPEEKEAYCKEQGTTSALSKIITSGFKYETGLAIGSVYHGAIQLIYFFTAGSDEVKCWQIRKGSKAPQAAGLKFAVHANIVNFFTGAIHTDFERGFICAEVMKYDDLFELKTEPAVKAAGKYKQEGKNYVVQDGDVIFFKFNVTAKGK